MLSQQMRPERLALSGLKSCADATIQLAPLTVLSGANSAGKSTMLQGALLLKQSLEAPYDPGPVLLSGPHYEWTRVSQLLTRLPEGGCVDTLRIGFGFGIHDVALKFSLDPDIHGLRLVEMTEHDQGKPRARTWREGMRHSDIVRRLPENLRDLTKELSGSGSDVRWEVTQDHCLLDIDLSIASLREAAMNPSLVTTGPSVHIREYLQSLIHLPALRGNPTRAYPVTSTGPTFSGPFQPYTASLIEHWARNDSDKSEELNRWLSVLGLAAGVSADRASDTELAVMVTRSKHSDPSQEASWVDIADTGFGMSQSLPILVALVAAQPGQTVYIEQPEIHLHPKAQLGFVSLLVNTVARGVRVILETHSRLTLTGIQTLVAEQRGLEPEHVILHWFTQDADTGYTRIDTGQLDEHGRYADWPQDFADVSMQAEHDFLVASLNRTAVRS